MKENFEVIIRDLPFNPDYCELENAAKVVNANVVDLVKFILNSDIYNDEFVNNVEYTIQKEFMLWYPFDMDSDADDTWAYYASERYVNNIRDGETTLTPAEAAKEAFKEDEPDLAEIICDNYLPTFLEELEKAIEEEDGFYTKLFDTTESEWVNFDENDIKIANVVIENISKISAVDILHSLNNNYFSNINQGNRYARFDFYDCVKDLYNLIIKKREEGGK